MADLLATSRRLHALGIRRAMALIDRGRAEANLARFAARAGRDGIVFRPHFKTHQSAAVAEWFRAAGVTRAAVSSAGMAAYFAAHGWTDLTLAIGANPLETAAYDELAGRIRLGLTIDSPAACEALLASLTRPVALWIEIDTGHGRSGIAWDDNAGLIALASCLQSALADPRYGGPGHHLAGLLTHGGQSYEARSSQEAAAVLADVRERLLAARAALNGARLPAGLLSAGDTPGLAACADWSGFDEVRPGNFIFCDLMQLAIGACAETDLACAVACPVIGVYPQRGEAIVHAGAVHLSSERLDAAGRAIFGRLLGLSKEGFAGLLAGWEVTGLAQEHGRLYAGTERAKAELAELRPGDLVLIAPVHACLTCEQFASYLTLEGEVLTRYRRD